MLARSVHMHPPPENSSPQSLDCPCISASRRSFRALPACPRCREIDLCRGLGAPFPVEALGGVLSTGRGGERRRGGEFCCCVCCTIVVSLSRSHFLFSIGCACVIVVVVSIDRANVCLLCICIQSFSVLVVLSFFLSFPFEYLVVALPNVGLLTH